MLHIFVTKIPLHNKSWCCAGLVTHNNGNTAEFLPFNPSKGSPAWREIPYLQKPHPNMPGVSYMDGMLFVVAGGGPPFAGAEKTVFFNSLISHILVKRIFGSSEHF